MPGLWTYYGERRITKQVILFQLIIHFYKTKNRRKNYEKFNGCV